MGGPTSLSRVGGESALPMKVYPMPVHLDGPCCWGMHRSELVPCAKVYFAVTCNRIGTRGRTRYEFETGLHYLGKDDDLDKIMDFLTCGRLQLARCVRACVCL